MKFKYIGEDNCFCLELVAYGIKTDYLKHNEIIEVPNDNDVVINALNNSGLYIKVEEPVKVKKEKNK